VIRRHRISGKPRCMAGRCWSNQVPIPEPAYLAPRETRRTARHARARRKIRADACQALRGDIRRLRHISHSYAYPVKVRRAVCDDPFRPGAENSTNPKMDICRRYKCSVWREKRIYAIRLNTQVTSSTSRDIRSPVNRFDRAFALVAPTGSLLDNVTDDRRQRMFVLLPTRLLRGPSDLGHRGSEV